MSKKCSLYLKAEARLVHILLVFICLYSVLFHCSVHLYTDGNLFEEGGKSRLNGTDDPDGVGHRKYAKLAKCHIMVSHQCELTIKSSSTRPIMM